MILSGLALEPQLALPALDETAPAQDEPPGEVARDDAPDCPTAFDGVLTASDICESGEPKISRTAPLPITTFGVPGAAMSIVYAMKCNVREVTIYHT